MLIVEIFPTMFNLFRHTMESNQIKQQTYQHNQGVCLLYHLSMTRYFWVFNLWTSKVFKLLTTKTFCVNFHYPMDTTEFVEMEHSKAEDCIQIKQVTGDI